MNKTSTENKMIYDYFSGTGTVSADASAERAMTKIIEQLLTHKSVKDLEDGRLISFALMRDYQIAVSADDARSYFEKWTQAIRDKMGK